MCIKYQSCDKSSTAKENTEGVKKIRHVSNDWNLSPEQSEKFPNQQRLQGGWLLQLTWTQSSSRPIWKSNLEVCFLKSYYVYVLCWLWRMSQIFARVRDVVLPGNWELTCLPRGSGWTMWRFNYMWLTFSAKNNWL